MTRKRTHAPHSHVSLRSVLSHMPPKPDVRAYTAASPFVAHARIPCAARPPRYRAAALPLDNAQHITIAMPTPASLAPRRCTRLAYWLSGIDMRTLTIVLLTDLQHLSTCLCSPVHLATINLTPLTSTVVVQCQADPSPGPTDKTGARQAGVRDPRTL